MTKILDYCRKRNQKDQPLPPLLPYVKTIGTYKFRSFVKETKSLPVPYLFYGRPAHEEAEKSKKETDLHKHSISILVRQTTFANAELMGIFPFDKHAYGKGDFSDYVDDNMSLEDFNLSHSCEEIPLYVSAFFGNNLSYCQGAVKQDMIFGIDDLEAEALYKIIRSQDDSDFLDRRFTIEVHPAKVKALVPFDVIAIALPADMQQDDFVQKMIYEWKAQVIPIFTSRSSKPDLDIHFHLENIVKYYAQNDLLGGR
jgi:hypothetical protein